MQVASEMVQRDKVLATRPNTLSSIPRIHMVEGKNMLLNIVLWPLQSYHGMIMYTYTHTVKNINKNVKHLPYIRIHFCSYLNLKWKF